MTSQGLQTFQVRILAKHFSWRKGLWERTSESCTYNHLLSTWPLYVFFDGCTPRCLHCCLERVTGAVPSLAGAQILYNTVCWQFLCVETLNVHHHPLESSWETRCVAQEWTAFCLYWTPEICLFLVLCVSQCVCLRGRGRQTVRMYCMLLVCVCVGHCIVDWRTLANTWSWSSSHDFWHFYMKYLHWSSFSHLVSIPYRAVSSLNRSGKGLGTRVVVLSPLSQTAIPRR